MLGPFGETLVVDWGLAKPFASAAPAGGATTAEPAASTDDGAEGTAQGQAVGTPAYMPPEQAAGRLDELGPAADVFSLGATLYALLTGRPPYQSPYALTVLEQARQCQFPRPRVVNP